MRVSYEARLAVRFKVKLNSMYWYAEMPYLVNITAGMPTMLEAVAVR